MNSRHFGHNIWDCGKVKEDVCYKNYTIMVLAIADMDNPFSISKLNNDYCGIMLPLAGRLVGKR